MKCYFHRHENRNFTNSLLDITVIDTVKIETRPRLSRHFYYYVWISALHSFETIFRTAPRNSSRKRVKEAIPRARKGLPGIIKSGKICEVIRFLRVPARRSERGEEKEKLWHAVDEIFWRFDQRARPRIAMCGDYALSKCRF